jgi:hypothetical protein
MGACEEEDEGGKAMATAIRMVGDKEGKGNEEGFDTVFFVLYCAGCCSAAQENGNENQV